MPTPTWITTVSSNITSVAWNSQLNGRMMPSSPIPGIRKLTEGQLSVAVQDGSICFLFENKGSQYDQKGFKTLAVLNQNCPPDSIANAFTMLMSLFNDSLTNSKEIMAFCSHFNGMVKNMARCKVTISPILLVIFFLWAMHPHYKDLLKQVCSRYKSFESASLDSIVAVVCYHDKFKLVGLDNKKSPAGKAPRAATAATNVVKQGKEWNKLFELLYTLQINSLKKL